MVPVLPLYEFLFQAFICLPVSLMRPCCKCSIVPTKTSGNFSMGIWPYSSFQEQWVFFSWYLNLKPNHDLEPHRPLLLVLSFLLPLDNLALCQQVLWLGDTYVGDSRALTGVCPQTSPFWAGIHSFLKSCLAKSGVMMKFTTCGHGAKLRGDRQLFESVYKSSFNPWKQRAHPQEQGSVAFPRFCSFKIKNICLSAI